MGQTFASSWLIDGSGYAWREGTYEATHRFGGPRRSAAHIAFLVRNAGFVRATTKGRIISAEFVRDAVDPHALIGLLHLLKEQKPVGVAIVHVAHDAGPAMMYRAQQAWLDYIGSLITFHKSAEIRVKRSVPLCLSPFYSRYKAGEEVVRSVSDEAARDRILEQLFQGKFTVARLDAERDIARIVGVGSSILSFNPKIRQTITGTSVVDVIDKAYGTWIMQQYLDVIKSGAAVAEDIDATIVVEEKTPVLLRYSRLAAPIQMGSGEHWILCVSQSR